MKDKSRLELEGKGIGLQRAREVGKAVGEKLTVRCWHLWKQERAGLRCCCAGARSCSEGERPGGGLSFLQRCGRVVSLSSVLKKLL